MIRNCYGVMPPFYQLLYEIRGTRQSVLCAHICMQMEFHAFHGRIVLPEYGFVFHDASGHDRKLSGILVLRCLSIYGNICAFFKSIVHEFQIEFIEEKLCHDGVRIVRHFDHCNIGAAWNLAVFIAEYFTRHGNIAGIGVNFGHFTDDAVDFRPEINFVSVRIAAKLFSFLGGKLLFFGIFPVAAVVVFAPVFLDVRSAAPAAVAAFGTRGAAQISGGEPDTFLLRCFVFFDAERYSNRFYRLFLWEYRRFFWQRNFLPLVWFLFRYLYTDLDLYCISGFQFILPIIFQPFGFRRVRHGFMFENQRNFLLFVIYFCC